jgi:hypothetical protein
VLIALAATLLMPFNGWVAGISGILAACLDLRDNELTVSNAGSLISQLRRLQSAFLADCPEIENAQGRKRPCAQLISIKVPDLEQPTMAASRKRSAPC